ncbi:hypothetical protein BH09BAC3_BH09BAC3_12720 [soil metagenome]
MKAVKLLLLSSILFCGSIVASAQLSVGLDLGSPVGNFSNIAATGFGGSLRYDKTISDKLSWTAAIGYLSFGGKNYSVGNVSIPFGNTTDIPISGGLKYYFSEADNGFYGGLDLNVNFLSTYAYSYNSGNGGGYNLVTDSQTLFGISPGIGYRLTNWDFSGRYNAVGDFSYLGLRVAYVINSK